MGDANKFLPRIFSPLKIIPEKIATTEYVSCNPRSTAAFPRITPVEPPIVNINKKRSAKSAELVLSCNNGGFPRYVLNQLKIFVPVGKDIKIVTPVNKLLYQFLNLQYTYDVPKQHFQQEKYSSWQRSLIGSPH